MSSDIKDFLNSYPPQIQQLATELRDFVIKTAPECTETLHTGWKVISYGYRKKFCAIAPHAKWVNLQFHSGASLIDHDHLLSGSGKSMRHVKIASTSDIGAELASLVEQAAKR